MDIIENLFLAKSGSFYDTMMAHNGVAGYKIPEYQRQYNWDQVNLERLLADCLNGFNRLAESSERKYTFLGSIILLTDSMSEPSFDGTSLLVVDGQQRLTSLILMACALFQRIREHRNDILQLSSVTQHWLNAETEAQLNALHQCALGQFTRLGTTFPYPRIIRTEDHRGDSQLNSEYRSAIGRFLRQFADYATAQSPIFRPKINVRDKTWDRLEAKYRYIGEQLDAFLYKPHPEIDEDDPDQDVRIVKRHTFRKSNLGSLFRRSDTLPNQSIRNRCSSDIVNSVETEGLVRLLLFSSYLTQRVVFTRVEARNETDAFDIFDALNTTGEPLTALETCKPLIIQFENSLGKYPGSDSEYFWTKVESGMAETYSEPAKLQTEIRHLLTSFALYLDGTKLPLDLKEQRTYLRSQFQSAERKGHNTARLFVRSLSDLAEFRLLYWDKNAIDRLSVSQYQEEELDILKLCLRFISDMNTSLAVPVLARYWAEYGDDDRESTFVSATKAVTAFLALRRAVTGRTARIDSDFRNLMKQGEKGQGRPLCLGPRMTNELISVEALREIFRNYLRARRIGVEDKASWIRQVKEVEFGNQAAPRPLCRFLLLAAAHNARADESRPGLLTVEGVIPSAELDFLSHRNWIDEKYATLEHVAPDAGSNGGWDRKIYDQHYTRHTIGNLVLLPEKENQSIGNADWNRKKVFYSVLSGRTSLERENLIESASTEGLRFGKKTLTLLHNQVHLNMLDPLARVDEWSEEFINNRTENLLELAWNQIAPWLYD